MGSIINRAVIVQGSRGPETHRRSLYRAYHKAQELDVPVTGMYPLQQNKREAFVILPSGSKEGWDTEERHAEAREKFKSYLERLAFDDGSHPLTWVEVEFDGYGDEVPHGAQILDSDRHDDLEDDT